MPSKIIKIFIFFLWAVVFGWPGAKQSSAFSQAFVTVVNPVRGREFWGLKDQEPLTAVKAQKKILEEYHFSATWLLRPDVVFDSELANYFQDFPPRQELGLFLEVTPIWADEAGVDYHFGPLWHYANSVFLSGYLPAERRQLLDSAFRRFHQVFGFYPRSVGAWHLDAQSLAYLRKHYGVSGALICADQFLTDGYQIWGGWWGVPYYPSRVNVLIPAQTKKNKLDLVVFQWAARDPVNGYGGGSHESTFSVQANDYFQHHLGTNYFAWLVDVYTRPKKAPFGQLTVGLENDYPWSQFGPEYKNQIRVLAEKKLKVVTMAEFSRWYREHFPALSPPHQLEGQDPLGSGQRATWLMSTRVRLGLLEKGGRLVVRDWRLYNENWPEPYLETANTGTDLILSLPAKIDTVRFPDQARVVDPDQIKKWLAETTPPLPFQTPKLVWLLVAVLFVLGLVVAGKLNKFLALLVGLGSLTQSLTMIKSGLLYRYGMGFWGPNGHDGIWHLALINELTKHFPPRNPVFSGRLLVNYHYLFDFLTALIHRLTGLPIINLYFQILPLLFSLSLGILSYLMVKRWTRSELSSLLAAFFAYFGGNFGWLITLSRGQGLGGESMFWANQAISFLINPPFALSLIFIWLGFYLYLAYQKTGEKKLFFILALIFGSLIGIKAYGGVVVLIGLALASVWEGWQKRKLITGRLFLASLVISLMIFLPANRTAASLFVLAPLWFPHTMLAFTDRLGWIRLEQARQVYLATGRWGRWFLAESLGLGIFLIGNLGTRVVGIGQLARWLRRKKLGSFEIFFLGCLLSSFLISLLVIQKGNPWNSIQFFYYFLFLTGILAAWWLGEFLVQRSLAIKVLVLGGLVLLTLPTTVGTSRHYWPSRAPARVGFGELEALAFLREQAEGIVLTVPFDPRWREKFSAPRPLYAYETTAYVAALGGQPVFLEDEMNLTIIGLDFQSRQEMIERFLTTTDLVWAKKFLSQNKIRYLYLVKGQQLKIDPWELGFKKIFENGEVRIYEFRDKIEPVSVDGSLINENLRGS